jgi:phosphopantothenoylcysteine decarboxylase / phosphopantothenate---cysteine ligase
MPRILLGVCGGIAAYKALELTRLATKAGHSVRVVCTEAATQFVGTASFAGITGAPVLIGEFEADPLRGAFPGEPLPEHAPLSHLALVENADVYVIAPATAHTLAKLAHGLADNLLTAAALACRRPMIVAPAMNNAMYENPVTQANLDLLRERGVTVLEPGTGPLGSPGEFGIGRLPEPPEILAAIEAKLSAGGELDGLNVLVTAGGTREPIDSVRYVGNRSSGRMGLALAAAAERRGATVLCIAANVSIPRPAGIEYVDVESTAQLAAACDARFDGADVLIMAAAVADYAPAAPHAGKLKKDQTGEELNLRLERTQDVLSGLAARRRPGQVLVGFAAEHGDGALEHGRGKLTRKNLDAVVVNDIGAAGIGFDAADNEVWIVTDGEERHVPRTSKERVAEAILDAVLNRRSSTELKVRR